MSYAIITIYINITTLALIKKKEKDNSMIKTRHLENVVVIFFQTIML